MLRWSTKYILACVLSARERGGGWGGVKLSITWKMMNRNVQVKCPKEFVRNQLNTFGYRNKLKAIKRKYTPWKSPHKIIPWIDLCVDRAHHDWFSEIQSSESNGILCCILRRCTISIRHIWPKNLSISVI